MGCCRKSLFQIALILASFGVSHLCYGQIAIPQPVIPNGQDEIRLPDGTTCRSGVAPDAYLDGGIYQTENNSDEGGPILNRDEVGVYVRVLVPLNFSKQRLNCNRLYEKMLAERELDRKLSQIKEKVFN